jgi:hypothetical protein
VVDWEHRLGSNLKIGTNPDHAGVDRAGSDGAVAEIVGYGLRC